MMRLFFGIFCLVLVVGCDDFELKKMGGLGEPCFENGLCDSGLTCAEGTCIAVAGDMDESPSDGDMLMSDTDETTDSPAIDGEEPEGDVGGGNDDAADGDVFDTDIPDNDVPGCGNGSIDSGEECDDSNKVNGDGCSSDCVIEPPDPIIDLAAVYSGQKDLVLFQWTSPGPQDYCYDSYRVCVDTTCSVVAKTGLPGNIEGYYASVPWYTALHQITVQPMRGNDAVGNAASLQINTDLSLSIQPTAVDFGNVNVNTAKDETVTVTNTSSLVDLALNEVYLPMDCDGKVSIVSGEVTPGDGTIVAPGETHEVLLRYAPTEVSACVTGDRLTVQWITYGSPYYKSEDVPIMGRAINSPPVITVEFSKNPVKTSEGTTRITVYVNDPNGGCDPNDIVEAVWDYHELGGGPRDDMWHPSCSPESGLRWYWRDINVSALSDGIYVIPVTVTDSAGNIAQKKVSFAVYSGKIIEVGSGKPHSSIATALSSYVNGDIIVVYPGTYQGTANTATAGNGKNLLLYGIAGPKETIIDLTATPDIPAFNMIGGQSDSIIGGFTVRNGEKNAVIVDAVNNPQRLTLTDCRFEYNGNATTGSSTILVTGGENAELQVRHSSFIGNGSSNVAGGAIRALVGTKVSVLDSVFEGNTGASGGAIYLNGVASALFDRVVFSNNRGSQSGGAVSIYTGTGTSLFVNTIFSGNQSNSYGGAIDIDGNGETPTVKIFSSTIVHNKANGEAGGISVMQGNLYLKNTILFFNEGEAGLTSQLFIHDDGVAPPEVNAWVDNCALGGAPNAVSDLGSRINNNSGGLWGSTHHNIFNDPLFVASEEGIWRYRLKSYSPCIDAASDDADVPARDFLGYSRFNIPGKGDDIGIDADMGAFEYIQ